MRILSLIGNLILNFFNSIGNFILYIPEIPHLIKNIDSEGLKQNLAKKKSNLTKTDSDNYETHKNDSKIVKNTDIPPITSSFNDFDSKEKENIVLRLQILSASFLVFSILFIFNFISMIIYAFAGLLIVGLVSYYLFKRVKTMYMEDFSAYRDFFIMYIASGILLVVIGTNQVFLSLFPFDFLPSISIFILAIILVVGILSIFRIAYHRNFTYGLIIEAGKKTAYVRVDYDIRSNVKPDIYLVENLTGAKEDDIVKLQIDQKIFSTSGNKPVRIIENLS